MPKNNLGNIPSQKDMSNEQEQTFTNGINKGRKLMLEEVIKALHTRLPSFFIWVDDAPLISGIDIQGFIDELCGGDPQGYRAFIAKQEKLNGEINEN